MNTCKFFLGSYRWLLMVKEVIVRDIVRVKVLLQFFVLAPYVPQHYRIAKNIWQPVDTWHHHSDVQSGVRMNVGPVYNWQSCVLCFPNSLIVDHTPHNLYSALSNFNNLYIFPSIDWPRKHHGLKTRENDQVLALQIYVYNAGFSRFQLG